MAYYSGLVVTCAPGAMDAVLAALKSSKTAEVHQTDPATGRIVVVIEDDSVHGEAASAHHGGCCGRESHRAPQR